MVDNTAPREAAEHINVKVQAQNGACVHFKIKRNTQLKKLMTAYGDRMGVKLSSIRFIFDGNTIHENDTPTSIDLDDDDTIEVFQTQVGGASEAEIPALKASPSRS